MTTADNLLNPPELGTLKRAVGEQMTEGVRKAVVLQATNDTFGRGSYIRADLWKTEKKDPLEQAAGAGEGFVAGERRGHA